jgi:hypothetical protein
VTRDGDSAPVLPPVGTRSGPPPPISGGALLILADGITAVAADPDRYYEGDSTVAGSDRGKSYVELFGFCAP